MGKLTKKSITKRLDKLWSEAVKKRAEYRCEYCLRDDLRLNSCHIIGRRYRGTRFDLNNGLSLCVHHHMQFDQHGPEYMSIFKNLVGENKYEALRIKALRVTKWTIEEMLEIEKSLKSVL